MVVLLAVFSLFAKFSDDPGMMFPEGSESAAIYSAVRDAGLYSSMTVEVDTGERDGVSRMKDGIDAFAAEISALPGVTKVEHSVSAEITGAFSGLSGAFVQLVSPAALSGIDPDAAAASALAALLSGAPASVLRDDPGGFKKPFMESLRSWKKNAPFGFSAENGLMCDEAGRRVLIRVETDPSVVSDSTKASRLLAEISKPRPGLTTTVISPLVRAVENESLVRGDISRVSAVSSVALALVFLFLYKGDWRTLWIPVMPFVAAFAAAVACCAVFERVSLVVLGVGGGMAGFAVDQGIHVYTAVRGTGVRELGRLTRALATALVTSVAAFASAVVSGVPVFVQLGVFASLTLVFNFLLSRFLLPRLLGEGGCGAVMNVSPPSRRAMAPVIAAPVIAAAVLLSALSAVFLPRLESDFSFLSLDGTGAATRAAESAFADRWKNPSAGKSVVVVRDGEDALLSALDGCARWTPAALVPPSGVRAKNVSDWRSPETSRKISELKESLARSCAGKGLPREFFSPFFDALRKGMSEFDPSRKNEVIGVLTSVFLRRREGRYSALLFVPQDEIPAASAKVRDAKVLSPEAVDAAAVESFLPGFRRSALLCAVLMTLLVIPVYRRPSSVAIAFLPAVCAGLWGTGLAALTGFKVDASVCLACVLVFGLAVDYGVFALYRSEGDPGGNTARAMVLSAVTTLAGAAAMMAAGHPAVRALGTVIFFGISLTALSALYLVPALKGFRGTPLLAVVLLVSGCASAPRAESIRFPMQTAKETRMWNVTAKALWHSFPMLVAVNVDPADGFMHAVGMTPTGMTVFESVGRGGKESRRYVSPMVPEKGAETLFGHIQEDFGRIFFSGEGPATEGSESEGLWPFWGWSVEREGRSRDGKSFSSAVYENRSTRCGFVFREVDGND